ncbi:PREDICTED: glutathione S-transferase theta-1-like [Nanorana parkeri]|uniref:glutathione S-transferase theta-1-like n=1 Tax=Nanorana parkeri TaxID=125878 RepID=UPI0008549E15|nr:PREDICTED: glutathione S-transferase theta-1-like [Nanorana parkeri]
MSELELYLDLLSQPCRSVYLFAKVNNIPFQHHEMKLFKGDHLTERFKKVNPQHKVPVLIDGEFTLVESTAMLRYLAQKYNTPDHWYPSDEQKRTCVDEYLAWEQTNTRPNGCRVFWEKCMTPAILGHDAELDKLNHVLAEFIAVMKHVEETFLKDRPFLAGDEISLADLVTIVEIMQVVASGVPVFEQCPKLEAWKQRIEEALGPEVFKEAHKDILNVKEQLDSLSPEVKEQLKGRLLLFTKGGMWLC